MTATKKLIIVTGLSGAGKHQVLYQLEDFGYFCVDNLPAPLLVSTLESMLRQGGKFSQVAMGMDIRTEVSAHDLEKALDQLAQKKLAFQVLFLEAEETELLKRFAETRRPHPINNHQTLSQRIQAEAQQLAGLRGRADYVVDTTRLTPPELRAQLAKWLAFDLKQVNITISSFGFKYGVPKDADMVLDMRCLPNPFYDSKLKGLNGRNKKVQQFVLKHAAAKTLLVQMEKLVKEMLPGFFREGKFSLHLALGCTGGQHRSVVMAEHLSRRLPGKVRLYHRELARKPGERDV